MQMRGTVTKALGRQAAKKCDPKKGLVMICSNRPFIGPDGKTYHREIQVLKWHPDSRRAIYKDLKRKHTRKEQ